MRSANSELIAELLPILDDLERSINSRTGQTDFDSFYEGIKLIYPKFMKILERHGLEAIESIGKEFDPNVHEALMTVESNGKQSNIIVDEHLKGYKINDRVIRHPQVIVTK